MGRLYDKRRWHRVRERKLRRDPICEGCGERPSEHVDHIIPLPGGAAYDPANHMALCIPCHNAKTRCDEMGKPWVRPIHRGCNADGSLRDPSHPWAVASLQPRDRTAGPPNKNHLLENEPQ
ncbi:MAG: hypothetical protein GEU95_01680 [Rhizobiales bacterium]|nr:hypothetical protein [Hyphomicrobiales bacterium]